MARLRRIKSSSDGTVTVETAITVSVLLVIFLGACQIVLLLLVQYDLQQATREAARVASIIPIISFDDSRVGDAVRGYMQYPQLISGLVVKNSLPEVPDPSNVVLNASNVPCNRVIYVESSGTFSFLGANPFFWMAPVSVKADASMRYFDQPLCN